MADDETVVDIDPEVLDEEALFLEDDELALEDDLGEKDELDLGFGSEEI